MHYFTHAPCSIAAVEDDKRAELFAHAGWEEVGFSAFRAAWRERDRRDIVRLWGEQGLEPPPLLTRSVNEPWVAPWRIWPKK